jgi:hypothetical protein
VKRAAYDAALKFVNDLRTAHGAAPLERLPSGKACESAACPIARGLHDVLDRVTVGRKTFGYNVGGIHHIRPLPCDVVKFVGQFDRPVRRRRVRGRDAPTTLAVDPMNLVED